MHLTSARPILHAMTTGDLLLRSRRTVTPRGIEDLVVVARGGRIAALLPASDPAARGAEDLGELHLLPGLVDTHVHVDEPGRVEWEGFRCATRAAAAGGITTLVDMPLNSVPATVNEAALRAKRDATAGNCAVDVGFWGGVVPGNAGELGSLAAAGVRGFKCFLVPSGVDEFPSVGEPELRAAMPAIERLGLPLLVHAELPGPIEAVRALVQAQDPRRYATWLGSRPCEAEHEAIAMMMRLCEETRCRVHIVHLASAGALPMLRQAKRRGLPITVETSPHYLAFAAEEIGDGATLFKCAPPIRGRAHRDALWDALGEGVIDFVASDHSPCPPEMKRMEGGDFFEAWGGIASLEIGLAALWTWARVRGFTPCDLARWLSARPARLAGLDGVKGAIAVGQDADLIAWDAEGEWRVEAERLHQRHPITAWAGRQLTGRVERTYLRGELAYEAGRVVGEPRGRVIERAVVARGELG